MSHQELIPKTESYTSEDYMKFFSNVLPYHLPYHICSVSHSEGKLVFNLLVEDVYMKTTDIQTNHEEKTIHVKFSVVKVETRWVRHYTFMVELPVSELRTCAVAALSTRVVLTIFYSTENQEDLETYKFGRTLNDLKYTTIIPHQVLVEDSLDENEAKESDEPKIESVEDWSTTEI